MKGAKIQIIVTIKADRNIKETREKVFEFGSLLCCLPVRDKIQSFLLQVKNLKVIPKLKKIPKVISVASQ